MTLAQMLADAQTNLRSALATRQSAQDALIALRSAETLTEADVTTATAARDAADAAIETARAVVAGLEAEIARDAELDELSQRVTTAAPRPAGGARVTDEPEVYRRGDHTVSYFRDLARAQTRVGNDISGATERLMRNARSFPDQVRNATDLQTRALTTTDGAGGDFVPPLWLINQFIYLARPGRVMADLVNNQPLPGGTDTISLPRLATGTATAQQATQNTAIQNTDATTNSVSAAVLTIAGGQSLAQQLLDQSPISMDEILLQDLALDYAVKADVFVISNNATNAVGLLSASTTSSVYTSGTPTVAGAYSKIADLIQQIHTARYMPPSVIVMHPRRWAWFLAAVDTAGRPLVVPNSTGFNAIAGQDGVTSAGQVGTLQGLPVYTDPNIPINLGAGTNEDRIFVMRAEDVIFYESTPRAEASIQPGFMNLTVNLRFFRYVALHASRFQKAIGVLSGTGLTTPVF